MSRTNIIHVRKLLKKKLIRAFLRTLSKENFLNLIREFNYFNGDASDEYFHPLGCFDMEVPKNLDSNGQDKLCVIYGFHEIHETLLQALLIWNHKGTNLCYAIDISGAFPNCPTNIIY